MFERGVSQKVMQKKGGQKFLKKWKKINEKRRYVSKTILRGF